MKNLSNLEMSYINGGDTACEWGIRARKAFDEALTIVGGLIALL